ncbi:MAG: general secretion pathway protein GspB [Lysobacterales bacterium]|jgi:hypothetical protein
MSILLEALRKTEQQQRPAPTIHDEDPKGSGPGPVLNWPMVAMMAVALIASGWAVWRQYEAPEGVYRPPVTLAPGQAGGTQTQAARESSADTAPAEAAERPATAPQKPLAGSPARSQRTPVESYSAPASSGTSASNSGPGITDGGHPAATRGNTAAESMAGASTNPGLSATRQPAAAETREAAEPHIPEPIGYWELPDAVRANVPEIRFSVLVYDEDPDGRFVLVNGQRLGEGDELQQGLAVEQIRRDGVVFSYRLYHFFVGR